MKQRFLSFAIVFVAILSLFVLGACQSPEKKFAGYLNDYIELVNTHTGDCDELAKKMDKFIDRNGREIQETFEEVFEKILHSNDRASIDKEFPKFNSLHFGECYSNINVKKSLESFQSMLKLAVSKAMLQNLKKAFE